MLSSSIEKPSKNAFDDFFDNELFGVQEDNSSDPSLEFIEQYLCSSPGRKFDQTAQTNHDIGTSQPWRNGLWCLTRDPAILVEKTRIGLPSQAFVSPTDTLNNGYNSLQSSDETGRKGFNADNLAFASSANHQDPYVISFDQEQDPSPTALYPQSSYGGDDRPHDSWQQDFQNFNLQTEDINVFPQDRVKYTQIRNGKQPLSFVRNNTMSHTSQSPTRYHYPFPQSAIQRSGNASNLVDVATSYSATEPDYMTDWKMENSLSSDGSQNSYQSLSQSKDFNAMNGYVRSMPYQRRPPEYDHEDYDDIITPVPRPKAHTIVNQYEDIPTDSLISYYPLPEEIGRAVSYAPDTMQEFQTTTNPHSPTKQKAFTAYPSLPYRTSKSGYKNHSTPSLDQTYDSFSYSPSPPPPISPAYRSSNRASHQRSPSRPERTRRKSIHKTGPIKEMTISLSDTPFSPTRSRSRTRSHSRSRSSHGRIRSASSKLTKASKHSSAPANTIFDFDFVNYTAQDSEKLMSDVAPSGSSKTRARREQEAKDKTKKLSEAAITAVRNAGGDVRDLKKRLAL